MAKRIAGAMLAVILLLAAAFTGHAQQEPATAQAAAAQPSAPPLTIGSGDLIDVGIFDTPELSGRFRINQKGDVELPLIGLVHVGGLTSEQAAKVIQDRYVEAQYLKPEASQATVFIEEYATQGITVTGEVKNPGIYPAFGVRMLNDVVTAAGGVSPTAASGIVITRRDDPQHPENVTYNPQALRPVVPVVQIFPGDTVLVPRAGIVYVLGDVIRAGGFVLDGRNTLTAEEVMALAGGQGHAAAMKRAQLVRTLDGGRRELITISLDGIIKGKAPDVALQDGDVLYVPTSTAKMAAEQAISSALAIGTSVSIYRTAYQ